MLIIIILKSTEIIFDGTIKKSIKQFTVYAVEINDKIFFRYLPYTNVIIIFNNSFVTFFRKQYLIKLQCIICKNKNIKTKKTIKNIAAVAFWNNIKM